MPPPLQEQGSGSRTIQGVVEHDGSMLDEEEGLGARLTPSISGFHNDMDLIPTPTSTSRSSSVAMSTLAERHARLRRRLLEKRQLDEIESMEAELRGEIPDIAVLNPSHSTSDVNESEPDRENPDH